MLKVAWSPTGRHVATAGIYGPVRVWDVVRGTLVSEHPAHGYHGGIEELTFSPDGRRLASAARDTTVLIWEVPEPERGR